MGAPLPFQGEPQQPTGGLEVGVALLLVGERGGLVLGGPPHGGRTGAEPGAPAAESLAPSIWTV